MIHVGRINDRLHLYLSFQWAELRGPKHRHEGERDEDIRRISPHYHFKCSESEADEGGRKNKRGVREGGRKREWAFVCRGTDRKTKRT